jgi:Putative Ig domain
VELSPQPVYANNDVTVLITTENAGASPSRYLYRWHKNGEDIEGATGSILPHTFIRKGDVITVTVTTGDEQQAGASMSSRPVTISNSAPTVTAVGIEPFPLHPGTAVHAVVRSADNDDDPVEYSYQWFNNGAPLEDQTDETLDGDQVVTGARLQVQVTPLDGEATGPARMSPVAAVGSSPPRITSQPPTTLNDDGTYVYQVAAEAADGGPVTYSLKSAPEQMSIDPKQGLIRWKATTQDVGVHPIEIVATDAAGAQIIQRYELQIFDLRNKATAQPAAETPPAS